MQRLNRRAVAMAVFVFCLIAAVSYLPGPAISLGDACGKSSEAANHARSLSKERLSKLYADMQALIASEAARPDGARIFFKDKPEFPLEFADIHCVKISPLADSPVIMLEGCFDHFLYLRFHGLGTRGEKDSTPKVTLEYGEFPEDSGEETLWKAP